MNRYSTIYHWFKQSSNIIEKNPNFLLVKDIDITKKLKEQEKITELNNINNEDDNNNIGEHVAIDFKNCDFGIKGEEIIKKDEFIKTDDKILLKNLDFNEAIRNLKECILMIKGYNSFNEQIYNTLKPLMKGSFPLFS